MNRTVFYQKHVEQGAKMVEFGGWEMPVQYPQGIVKEHLATRKHAGLFDVSHMGRFTISGADALAFLQKALTNDAAALSAGTSQYTIIPNENGGAIDDAYLYCFKEREYLLVVNASNREKDWAHLENIRAQYGDVRMEDITFDMAMLSLQGPMAEKLLEIISSGDLPEPKRNAIGQIQINGADVQISRTGYTGEPICFELFMKKEDAVTVWDAIVREGAHPIGLGARDTLRLEAGLPLYGHEFGMDPEEKGIPIFACGLARFAVSFSPEKGDFIGKEALQKQFNAIQKYKEKDYSDTSDLPRRIKMLTLKDKGVARAGSVLYQGDKVVGFITSGTMVPYWKTSGEGDNVQLTDETGMRVVCLAMMDSELLKGHPVEIDVRGRRLKAEVVLSHLNGRKPPIAVPVIY